MMFSSIVTASGHGDLHVLISKLDREIAVNSSDVGKRLERAILLCQHGSFDLALDDLREVKKLAPKRSERHYVAARVYMGQEKWELAKSALDLHISAEPKKGNSYFLRSQVQIQREKLAEAAADLEKAIGLKSPAPLKYFLSLIQIQDGQGRFGQAIATCDHARKTLGDLPNVMMIQARLLDKAKRVEEASAMYALIRKKIPSLTFTMCLEESAMWEEKSPKKALDLLVRAEAAWYGFSRSKRDRAPMQKLYKDLVVRKRLLTK